MTTFRKNLRLYFYSYGPILLKSINFYMKFDTIYKKNEELELKTKLLIDK